MAKASRVSDLIELVPWILDQVVNGSFTAERDSDEELDSVEIYRRQSALTTEEMEKCLIETLPAEKKEALFTFRNDPAPGTLQRSMVQIFGAEAGQKNAELLSGRDWDAIVQVVYWYWCDYLPVYCMDSFSRLHRGVGSEAWAHTEAEWESSKPGTLVRIAEICCARELINLYPRMVRREASSRVLSTSATAPAEVTSYVSAAYRCYVYGQFLAALALCRSAIECAVEDRLRARGFSKEVEKIADHRLLNLLDLAKRRDVLDSVLGKQADDIRELANDALHGAPPSEDECKKAHDVTRGILERLYS